MKKSFRLIASAAALLGAVAVPSVFAASTFHLVVPLGARTQAQPPVDPITVSLAGAALPKATVNQAYSESLRPYLSVTGDAAFDPAAARWSLVSGALPVGLNLDLITGQIAGIPSVLNESGASFDVAVAYEGESAQQTYTLQVGNSIAASCYAHLLANPGAPSGWYTLDPDGDGPGVAQSYYCDMTSEGGGWTRIVRQTETEPVTNWNGGVNGQSYALATEQIPQHTQTAFGKDEEATFVDYFDYKYTTGPIDKTTIFGFKANQTYHIARLTTKQYPDADPENTPWNDCGTTPAVDTGLYCNFLTLDRTGNTYLDWTFIPNPVTVERRGYALKGANYEIVSPYAWSVWVR